MFHSSFKTETTKLAKRLDRQSNKRITGSALVIAIFVIIVMSLLGAALVKIMESSHENVAFEVLGTRAYAAAQTGVQWQLQQIFPLAAVGAPPQAIQCSVISNSPPSISHMPGMQGCEIILDAVSACEDFEHNNVRYYRVTSTGQCQIDGEVTSRTVQVEARSL